MTQNTVTQNKEVSQNFPQSSQNNMTTVLEFSRTTITNLDELYDSDEDLDD